MKAKDKVEKIAAELTAAQERLGQYQAEKETKSSERIPLETERASLLLLAKEGDAAARKRLAAVRREIIEAMETESELAELILQMESKIGALRIALNGAEDSFKDQIVSELRDAVLALDAEIDAELPAVLAKLQKRNELIDEALRTARAKHKPTVPTLRIDHAARWVRARVSQIFPEHFPLGARRIAEADYKRKSLAEIDARSAVAEMETEAA